MNLSHRLSVGLLAVILTLTASLAVAQDRTPTSSPIKHVLLISIDGMHSVDFANCVNGVPAFGNENYCPHLTALASTGVHYLQALTSKPSDSFPGLVAQITGGTPRSAGIFYDVSYDRALSPPFKTTPYGIVGGPTLCPSVIGTQVGFDEEIDYNYSGPPLRQARWQFRNHRHQSCLSATRPEERLQAGLSSRLHSRQHHLQRGEKLRRLHGVVRQASLL